MRVHFVAACLLASVVALFSVNLSAQVVPKSISAGGSDAAMREQKNAWTIGIVGGLFSGTYMRLVDEMASALNDGDNLRILPIVSNGAASNLDDLLYLHGVDAAITQSDVFEYFRPSAKRRISNAASTISSGCRFRNCTSWRAIAFRVWKTCVEKRSISVRPERVRA